ncbi:hypothetical protein BC936DRAFT_136616 [Jimgerdemannia flammicorona]|uniref:Granulins domain-containing protein n=1 Tax=Jimgerdemannia flammicorona TaxID=994334 RepID=A0A433CZ52_9FUNG|nr:hypothetical protein BC936DRAFT_136616 [Jimgerdemannia flammicorona]
MTKEMTILRNSFIPEAQTVPYPGSAERESPGLVLSTLYTTGFVEYFTFGIFTSKSIFEMALIRLLTLIVALVHVVASEDVTGLQLISGPFQAIGSNGTSPAAVYGCDFGYYACSDGATCCPTGSTCGGYLQCCTAGYSACPGSAYCCPTGVACLSNNRCDAICGPTDILCSTGGCCKTGQRCDTVLNVCVTDNTNTLIIYTSVTETSTSTSQTSTSTSVTSTTVISTTVTSTSVTAIFPSVSSPTTTLMSSIKPQTSTPSTGAANRGFIPSLFVLLVPMLLTLMRIL